MLLIVAIILIFVLPSPWNVVGAVAAVALFMGELFFWQHRGKRIGKAVGAETIVGAEATVVSPCRPRGQVRVGGEIWAARCAEGADQDEPVRVVAIDGITLEVERIAT
jgi:membrane-bound serine protease (ClpP class)